MDLSTTQEALRQCGNRSKEFPGQASSVHININRHPVIIAARMTSDDERMASGWDSRVIAQVMIRVDAESCERLGLESGHNLDLWIAKIEPALSALILRCDGSEPPWPGYTLKHNVVNKDDPWVGHIKTNGRYRSSMWLIVR
jgi:hypothetical protein